MPSSDQLLFCHSFAHQLAPEIASSPLYVVASGISFTTCKAFATRGIDLTIRQQLVDAGQWQGPGGTIVIGDVADSEEDLLGLLTHELAHLLPFAPSPADVAPSAAEVDHHRELVYRWATEPENEIWSKLDPWFMHEIDFHRIALHLHHRAERLGFPIPLPCLGICGPYQLSGAWRYRDALGNEPARTVDATFAEILSTPAPQQFTDLFAADCADWLRRKDKSK